MFAKFCFAGLFLLLLQLYCTSLTPALLANANNTVITDCSNDTQLRNAVAAGGTITFNCGVATLPLGAYMQINIPTVIDGADKITLDGAGISAFFQVFADKKLTLKNLTLRNGRFASAHPLEVFGDAELDGVTLTNNQTGSAGGVVTVSGSLLVKNSKFNANTAASTNQAIAFGAAIYIDGGTVTIQNSSFTNNSVGGNIGSGGAITVWSGALEVTGSDFRSNFAPDGGAIFVGTGTQVTVTQSIFDSNSARYGGAIESNGSLQVDYSTFSNNKALVGDGGALWTLNGDTDITYSTFSNNESKTTGGALSCYANTLSVIHSTINDNLSSTNGGGIYSTCNVNLTNSTLSGNSASLGGGGIYQQSVGSATLSYVTIANNSATFGAGVYNDGGGGSTMTVEKSLLANNSTGNCDGVVESLGYNLASDNNCGDFTKTGDQKNATLSLGNLADNGGFTATMLPLAGNPAINHIPANVCGFSTDQRDVARPQNSLCDSGAVEVEGVKKLFLPLVTR